MDDFSIADGYTIANRNEPVPVLTITDDAASTSDLDQSEEEATEQRLQRGLTGPTDGDKTQDGGGGHGARSQGRQSLQDRLFNKLLQQLLPAEEPDSDGETVTNGGSSNFVKRPAFSIPLMTNNFRRFNARIGIVFVFQNRLERLFTWRTSSHTLSFLSVYTFVCLNPHLLAVIPLATMLLFVMVPAFLTRHPPPPNSASSSSTPQDYSYHGPALAPPRTIKPASETSKDFFRNMRDLQNSMADFAVLHDALIKLIAPPTNFSNEILSSALYFYLAIATAMLFIAAGLLPWKWIILTSGYSVVLAGHPTVQEWLHRARKQFNAQVAKPPSTGKQSFFGVPIPQSLSAIPHFLYSLSAITLDSAPEVREVEIFELQHRPLIPPGSSSNDEWTTRVFTPLPYDPLSPARISGDRPRGARFFEDVQPPEGWSWHSKKWELDLEAREWVSERLITGVEFDVSASGIGGEEFGGWVWDLPPLPKHDFNVDDDMWLAYGGGSDDINGGGGRTKEAQKKMGKKQKEKERKAREERRQKDWEEARFQGRTGEWRRRRWVRLVKRIGVDSSERTGTSKESTKAKGK